MERRGSYEALKRQQNSCVHSLGMAKCQRGANSFFSKPSEYGVVVYSNGKSEVKSMFAQFSVE